jgi:hypothetical protein
MVPLGMAVRTALCASKVPFLQHRYRAGQLIPLAFSAVK